MGLDRLGYNVVSDDICAIVFNNAGTPCLLPSYPAAKLGEKALTFFKEQFDMQQLKRSVREKLFVPFCNTEASKQAIPLKAVYGLEFNRHLSIRRRPQKHLLIKLLKNTHRKAIMQVMMGKRKHFNYCSMVAQSAEYYAFNRPQELNRFSESLHTLTSHIKEEQAH